MAKLRYTSVRNRRSISSLPYVADSKHNGATAKSAIPGFFSANESARLRRERDVCEKACILIRWFCGAPAIKWRGIDPFVSSGNRKTGNFVSYVQEVVPCRL